MTWPKSKLRKRHPSFGSLPRLNGLAQAHNESKGTRLVGVIATLAAILSVWVAYRQLQLQAEQTAMQVEQARLAKSLARQAAIQNLSNLYVRRRVLDFGKGFTRIEVCTKDEPYPSSISAYSVLWRIDAGRLSDASNRRPFAIVGTEEGPPEWVTEPVRDGMRCESALEPNHWPLVRKSTSGMNPEYSNMLKGGVFVTQPEVLVTVFELDKSGEEWPRYFLLRAPVLSSAMARQVSEQAATQWSDEYSEAKKAARVLTISGFDDGLASLGSLVK